MPIKNASSWPKVYYGMHMESGVAEYTDDDGEPYRICLKEETLKTMDKTYEGKPVYVEHVDEVDLDSIQTEADGYVSESFYNPRDGKHWAKFIVISDKGHEAIRRGWQLSNSYIPKSFDSGGEWHGVNYLKEITSGEYEHLAIVPNPRYADSIIMTPEEFKKYNDDKEAEIKRLTNSKKEKPKMALKFFKRKKVDNAEELSGTSVLLPKSGKEVTIEKAVELADAAMAKKKNSMADLSDKVKMHDGMMCNVGELLEKHKALHDELEEMKAKHDDEEEVEKEEHEKEMHDDDDDDDSMDDAEEKESGVDMEEKEVEVEGDDKSVDSDDDDDDEEESEAKDKGAKKKALQLAEHEDEEIEAAKKKKNAKKLEKIKAAKKAETLRNAHQRAFNGEDESAKVFVMADQVAVGKARYGSNQ